MNCKVENRFRLFFGLEECIKRCVMNMNTQVREILNATILAGKANRATIGDDDSLSASGLIDSLGLLMLVGEIEKKFHVKVPPRDYSLNTFDSVAKISAYLSGIVPKG
ncbi:MAG: hypothetical protein A2Z34_02925 [Planctomycetes bacterium RBG_16_59_8]|nr:MAG: hypothetical protein A2Z34_02925 [Planctomycetes bacterium RBG_16_59_8]